MLTTRLAHILATGRARPWELLAVTFTNKAAREMRERITAIIGPAAEGLRWLGTFHSIAAQILRRHAELVGLKSSYTIIDTDDQERLIKQLLEAENIDAKRWTPRHLAGLIDHWKNRGWTPDKLPPAEGAHFANNRGAALYGALPGAPAHPERLRFRRPAAAQPDHLHRATRTCWPSTTTGSATSWWTSTRTPTSPSTCGCGCWPRSGQNVCCVGDDDQSIYGWRGAEVDNILRFERDFPGAKVIRLERNYRSTGSTSWPPPRA